MDLLTSKALFSILVSDTLDLSHINKDNLAIPMDLNSIAKQLTRKDNLHPTTDIDNKIKYPELDGRGIYAWYFEELPSKDIPTQGCHKTNNGYTLLYIGIAPDLVGGEPSKQTLRKRLKLHTTGNIRSSTLRKTLACLLWHRKSLKLEEVDTGKPKLKSDSRQRLSEWISDNARIAWVAIDDPWAFEVQLIHRFHTPLNIECNQHHPYYRELLRKRAETYSRS